METRNYIEAVRKLTKTGTMYATAKALGVKQGSIKFYLEGKRYMDNYACLQVSTLLNVPLVKVIADVECQRARDAVKREAWIALAKDPTGQHAVFKNQHRPAPYGTRAKVSKHG